MCLERTIAGEPRADYLSARAIDSRGRCGAIPGTVGIGEPLPLRTRVGVGLGGRGWGGGRVAIP